MVRVRSPVRLWVSAPVLKREFGKLQNLPGGFSAVVPPDPMPNSEVKRRSADGSVGSPHARVGNCQALNTEALNESSGLFCMHQKSSAATHKPNPIQIAVIKKSPCFSAEAFLNLTHWISMNNL